MYTSFEDKDGSEISQDEANRLTGMGELVQTFDNMYIPILQAAKAPYKTLCLKVDMTEQRRLEYERNMLREQKFIHSRLEELGTICGAFAHDYNNILEGELYKSGLGVRALKDWKRQELFRGDSITRTYSLTADAGVAYRSNNSIGPDLTLKTSIRNLMGRGESFTIKGNGAYYWALRGRRPGNPRKTDTYKLGLNASLIFPYLHWAGDNNPDGDTRYMLGYQYENIAGGYGVHKISGSFTYFIHSPNNDYVTHAFTPFSLSVVMMKAETDSLLDKAAEFPQLIKVIAGDEFVPSIGYNFIYDNYRSKRAVNTFLNLGVKESGNLINALYCLAGKKWHGADLYRYASLRRREYSAR